MLETTLLNRYQIEAEIGQGGMGTVYRARDRLLDRAVAVKVLAEAGLGSHGRNRLLKEARAAAQLNHPNIVAIYDAGEAEFQAPGRRNGGETARTAAGGAVETRATAFIVMELVEGRTLYEAWPLPLPAVLDVAAQICEALEHAHAHGIVHRDLKLENVLLAAGGPLRVKLTDFGLARSIASRLTQEGTLIGTVFYVAPEVALGQPADGRADLYSLGVMLYELTTGKLPFTADDPLAVISQHLHAPVVPPRAHQPELPAALDGLIVRLLGKRPEDRPASAAEVRAAVAAIARGETEAAVQPGLALLDHIARGRLVARERETHDLRLHWQRAAAGEGHVLLVTGEPGIGKTRLVRELISRAEVSGGRVLTGECYAEGGAPYGPIAQMLRAALLEAGRLNDLGLPPAVFADLLTLAPDLQPHFTQTSPRASLEPQAEQSRVFESFVALCGALTARAPLLLFLDDAHWADSGTLFLLRHLARRTRRQPILTVLTYRETELDQACCLPDVLADLNRERLSARVKLGRFSLDETRELLAVLLQAPAADDLVAAIQRETEGNPFFVEEVCKALIEEGQLTLADGRWQATPVDEIVIPQSVRVTIQARLGKLPEPTQEALRLAAVLGREFDFDTLARASDLGEEALITALEAAEHAQLIAEARRAARTTFVFAHALIPATLRENTGRLRRQRLHRRAALAIEALRPEDYEALAYHTERAGDEERARAHYLRAGDRALAVFANQEAERHYSAALETLAETQAGQQPDRAHALAGLGEAFFRQGRYEQASQSWQASIPLFRALGDSSRAARLYARLGRAAWQTDDKARGLAICREGLALFKTAPESAGLAYLIHETGRACFFNHLHDEARTLCQQALEIGMRLDLAEVQAEALATLGLLPDETLEARARLLARSVTLAESADLPATAVRGHINLANAIQALGHPLSEVHDHMLRAREHARRIGHGAEELKCLVSVASTTLQKGDLAGYEAVAREARELAAQVPRPYWGTTLLILLDGVRLIQAGDFEAGLRLFDEAEAQAHAHPHPGLLQEVDASRANLCLAIGDLEQSEAAARRALAVKEVGDEAAAAYCTLAMIHAEQGRLAEAHAVLERAQSEAARWPGLPLSYLLAQARATLAAAEGRWEDADAEVATRTQP